MAFENSPKLDHPSKPVRTFSGWVAILRRPVLLGLTTLLVLFDILFMAYKFAPGTFTPPPGGMDGCLVTGSGAPFSATVSVDAITTPTDGNGCFFFAALKPGAHLMQVQSSAGIVYKQAITIISSQAVGLGTIKVAP
jgi:hypothetical protein